VQVMVVVVEVWIGGGAMEDYEVVAEMETLLMLLMLLHLDYCCPLQSH